MSIKRWYEGRQVSKKIQDKRKRRTIQALEESADQLELIADNTEKVSKIFELLMPLEVRRFMEIYESTRWYQYIKVDSLDKWQREQWEKDIAWLEGILAKAKA